MSTLSFLNSPLLWGLALASIPIIIHLLYRRKYRRVEWAPMHYLKLSIQRNRRRIRLEQLLLLLLRTFMVLLLFFLVARPVMHAAGIGKWLSGRSATSQILLIDDSLSMGYRTSGQPAIERARELAKKILDTVGPKDRFTLVLASQPRTPLVREVEVTDGTQLATLIGEIQAAETLTSWEPTLLALDELVNSATFPIREVAVITDLRRAGWDKPLSAVADRWLAGKVGVRVYDIGAEGTGNVALQSFEQADRLAVVGNPTRYEAVVRNDTGVEVRNLDANLMIDGKPSVVRVPDIAAGASVKVSVLASFAEAGRHHVSFQLPDDDLPGDNQRWLVTGVQESLRLLLVDGEPSSEPLAGEVDFLGLALSLGIGDADAFRVEVVTDSEWAAQVDSQPDLLVLANVANFTQPQVDALTRLVKSGVGLMIFPGEQVDPDNYNQLLYAGGQGLLPVAMDSIADEELTGMVVEAGDQSPLAALGQLNPAVLERIKLRKFFQVKLPEDEAEGVRVLARWNNASASPAVIEKAVGAGRVILWTVTADKAWSDWPTEPSYVLAVREAAKAIAHSDAAARTVTAGEALRRPLPPKHEITDAVVEVPHGDKPQPLQIATEATGPAEKLPAGDRPRLLVDEDTRRAGLYKMTWKDSTSGAESDLFAANPDARESDLARYTPDELKKLWSPLEVEVIAANAGQDASMAVQGQEIWRSLASCLLCLVVVEACFATWTGRQH